MAALLADTHAAVWYLEASPRLSAAALAALRGAIQVGDPVYVSAVSLVEIAYLVERRRLAPDTFDRVLQLLQQPGSGFVAVPFDVPMADAMRQMSAAIVPDMPDRMIAATALHLNVPLVTADRRLRSLPQPTVW